MFEKEAEEYIKKDGTETEQMLNSITLSLTSREAFVLKNAFKQTFKDGAEFAYKKTKAETALLSQHILDLQKDKGNLTDRVRELETQIEKMMSQYDYAFKQLRESREIVCLMLSQYENKKEIDYSTKERGKKLLKQGVYKYD